jgi:hypothetical protein
MTASNIHYEKALAVCFRGGFRRVLLRGANKFSQSERPDGWTTTPSQLPLRYCPCSSSGNFAGESF